MVLLHLVLWRGGVWIVERYFLPSKTHLKNRSLTLFYVVNVWWINFCHISSWQKNNYSILREILLVWLVFQKDYFWKCGKINCLSTKFLNPRACHANGQTKREKTWQKLPVLSFISKYCRRIVHTSCTRRCIFSSNRTLSQRTK